MTSNNNTSLQDQRLQHFEDTDVLRRVDATEAKRLSPKAKDCQRQLNEASSVWAVDGKKFLFVFAKKADGDQKVTVWGIKKPGEYQRIKTVLVANDDDIFEAIPVFLTEYFELELGGLGYRVDEDWYLDIQDELADLVRRCPSHLKPKQKLLRVWNDLAPKLTGLVIKLDDNFFSNKVEVNAGEEKGSGRMSEAWISRKTDEPADLDEEAEKLVDGINIREVRDIELVMALLDYDHAAMLHETRRKTHAELEGRELRMMQCSSVLMKMFEAFGFKNSTTLRGLNHTALLGQYADSIKFEKLQKGMRDLFKGQAMRALREKTLLSIDYLEFLVNARRLNKRLPKELSDHIKKILDHGVHCREGFWDRMPAPSSTAERLKQLWIQCMALRLYGYDPNEAYTKDELCNLMPTLLGNPDADGILAYARICHDSEFDSVMIDNFDSLVRNLAAKTSDKIELLKLYAARLLYKASAHILVPESELKDLEAPDYLPNASLETNASAPKTDWSSMMPQEQIREWINNVEHFRSIKEKGVSLRDFCLVKGLPYEEFRSFFEDAMQDYRDLEADPFIQKMMELPANEQQEFSSLFERHMQCVKSVCDSFSILCGEKIDMNDFIGNEPKVEDKLRKLMADLDNVKKKFPTETVKFIYYYEEMVNLEQQMRKFNQKHNLTS